MSNEQLAARIMMLSDRCEEIGRKWSKVIGAHSDDFESLGLEVERLVFWL